MTNIEALQEFLKDIADLGQNGDTLLAHITEAEARKLKAAGGEGTFHPITGLPQFFGEGDSGEGDGPGDDGGDDGDSGAAGDSGEGDSGEESASGAGGIGDGSSSGSGSGGGGDDADSSDSGESFGDSFGGDDPDAGLDPGEFGSIGASDIGESFTGPGSSVGGFDVGDPELGLEFGFNFENFDVDDLEEALEDIANPGLGDAIASFFGFGKTVGFAQSTPGFPADVETQTTFGISPVGVATALAFGLPGKIALAVANRIGFEDPFALEANLATFDIGLANPAANTSDPASSPSSPSSPDDAAEAGFSEGEPEEDSITFPEKITVANAGEFGLSSEFTKTIEKLLGPAGTFDFFEAPNFQLLDGIFEVDKAAVEDARNRVRNIIDFGRFRNGAV